MNELQIFNYEKIPVRTIMKEGEPWWVLADVCRVLDLSNPTMVAARLDEDEKQLLAFNPNPKLGLGHNGATIINESGLYKVILRSDKPQAKKFTRWVTHEVLPAIRKTGSYGTPKAKAPSVTEVIKLAQFTRDRMTENGATTQETAMAVKEIADAYGVYLPEFFVKPETLSIEDVYDMVDFIYSHERGRGKRVPQYEDFVAHKSRLKALTD